MHCESSRHRLVHPFWSILSGVMQVWVMHLTPFLTSVGVGGSAEDAGTEICSPSFL